MDVNKLTNIGDFKKSRVELKVELMTLFNEAKSYLEKQNWCSNIVGCWFDRSYVDKLAVFYFKIVPLGEADEFVWIIVGDIPPAYIDIETASNGALAIQAYTDIMEDWVTAVVNGEGVDEVYPIDAPANEEYASMLASRIKFIRNKILVNYNDELKA